MAATTVPAQDPDLEKYSAPILWTRYKVAAANVEVMLPKLPSFIGEVGSDSCAEVAGKVYSAYADESVYEFRYSIKSPDPPMAWCQNKIYFGNPALERRVLEIKGQLGATVTEIDGQIGSRKIRIFRSESANERWVRWVIPELENNRWLELAIYSRPDKKPDEKRFLESLVLSASNGVELLAGSPATLGDPSLSTVPSGEPAKYNFMIKGRPRPIYTEQARKLGTQGTVVLKVNFLANGGIGKVEVIKAIPFGLTEHAISAAKRIVFLPERLNGIPQSIVKQIEYSFSIY